MPSRLSLAAACAVAFALSANYTNHAPMLGALRSQFGFDQTAAGLLTTAVFLTHALMQIPGGRLADTRGAARVIGWALLWIAAGNVGIAFASAYWQLLFWKAFTGIGTGTCIIAGARYIVQHWSGSQLHLTQGLYGGSILIGSGFVIFAVPQLLGALGWRGSFAACAAVAGVVWLLWAFAGERGEAAPHAAVNWGEMLTHSQLWLLGVVQMASFGLVVVVGSWITALLGKSFSMPLKTAGLIGSLVLLIGIVTRPFGGWLVHRIGVGMLVRMALALNVAGCLTLAMSTSLGLTLAAILALGLGCGLPYAGIFNRAAALFPGRAGAAMGLVNMIGISMILAGAPAVGYLADWTGQFRSGFIALGGFSAAACAATFGIREK